MSAPQPHTAMTSTPPLEHVTWRKSSRSQGAGAECVELSQTPHLLAIRDSKDPDGARLMVGAKTAKTILDAIKAGHHDL